MKIAVVEKNKDVASLICSVIAHKVGDDCIYQFDTFPRFNLALSGGFAPDITLLDSRQLGEYGAAYWLTGGISFPVILTDAVKDNDMEQLVRGVEAVMLIRKVKALAADEPVNGCSLNIDQLPTYKERFLVSSKSRMYSVRANEVSYIHSKNRLLIIKTMDGRRHLINSRLDELIIDLDPVMFFKVNHAFVVAYDAIQQIHLHFSGKIKLVMEGDPQQDILVSRTSVARFKQWLGMLND